MENRPETVFSKKVRAGKKRTYFIDVRTTRSNDYFLTITESRRRLNEEGYDKNKLFLYKEDFNKFISALDETVNHVKKELLPDFDFSSFDKEDEDFQQEGGSSATKQNVSSSDVTMEGSNEASSDNSDTAKQSEDEGNNSVPSSDNSSPPSLLEDEGEKW